MIVSFTHKGLKLLWTKGDKSKLPSAMVNKITRLLYLIDNLEILPDDLQGLNNLRPHILKGDLKDYWSITVTGNWGIIFKFDNKNTRSKYFRFYRLSLIWKSTKAF